MSEYFPNLLLLHQQTVQSFLAVCPTQCCMVCCRAFVCHSTSRKLSNSKLAHVVKFPVCYLPVKATTKAWVPIFSLLFVDIFFAVPPATREHLCLLCCLSHLGSNAITRLECWSRGTLFTLPLAFLKWFAYCISKSYSRTETMFVK